MSGERGSTALVTALLLPLLIITFASALELGALRLVASRVRAAADLAAVVAIGDQDDGALAASGLYRPSPDAADVARAYFALNLEPLAGSLGSTPERVAAQAQVAVYSEPGGTDPRTGRRYEQPAISIAADVPVRTPGLAALLLRPISVVHVETASVAR